MRVAARCHALDSLARLAQDGVREVGHPFGSAPVAAVAGAGSGGGWLYLQQRVRRTQNRLLIVAP